MVKMNTLHTRARLATFFNNVSPVHQYHLHRGQADRLHYGAE